MPPRPKLNPMASGNPILARMSRAEARLDDHAAHLARHDTELRELNKDLGLLGDVVLRSQRRARGLLKLSTRKRRRSRKAGRH